MFVCVMPCHYLCGVHGFLSKKCVYIGSPSERIGYFLFTYPKSELLCPDILVMSSEIPYLCAKQRMIRISKNVFLLRISNFILLVKEFV